MPVPRVIQDFRVRIRWVNNRNSSHRGTLNNDLPIDPEGNSTTLSIVAIGPSVGSTMRITLQDALRKSSSLCVDGGLLQHLRRNRTHRQRLCRP